MEMGVCACQRGVQRVAASHSQNLLVTATLDAGHSHKSLDVVTAI